MNVSLGRGWDGIALCLFLTALAAPAPAGAQPPWVVEAPGGAGVRYGLGLDLFSEHQESLRITFNEERQTFGDTVRVLRTDPGLLNRKFKLRWDLKGVGVQPAVALSLPRTLGIYPTLVFQAAAADVSLDFQDRNRPEDSSSLQGRGPLFGTGLDLTRSLCRSCPWFAGVSYFFQKIPSLTVDRSPAFAPEGFEVLEDRIRLDRDVHEVSTRIGYGAPGSRTLSYLGASHRWNDVGIDDRLRYRDPFAIETSLSTRTRLASEVTLALAGVEARLAPGLFGRLEAGVGGGDRGALLRVVYLPGRSGNHPEQPTGEEAARIAGQLQEIRTELAATIDHLGETVALETLLKLLDHFEKEVLGTLPFPKYAALRDLVTYRFQQARDSLQQGSPAAALPSALRAVPAVFNPRLPSRIEPAALALADSRTRSEALRVLRPLLDLVVRMWTLANDDDLTVDFCVRTEPVQGAMVRLFPLSHKEGGDRIQSNDRLPLVRGLYGYHVSRSGYGTIDCPAGGSKDCRLDLLARARPFVYCKLSVSKGDPAATCFVTNEPAGPWECKSK